MNDEHTYLYMLLARLKMDCEYWLNYGNKSNKHLWAGTPEKQIAKIKELYQQVPVKPEWLSIEKIHEYEQQMTR